VRTLWLISIVVRGFIYNFIFYTPNYTALVFYIWDDSVRRLRSYCWETARLSFTRNISVHSEEKKSEKLCVGLKNDSHIFRWSRRTLSPCKVWGRSYNARRLYVRKCGVFLYGKLPVLNLLTARKSSFSPRRVDSLHRFKLKLAWPRDSRSAWPYKISRQLVHGWERGPKKLKISTFW